MTNIEATADRIIATGASKRDVIILAGKAAAELIAAGVPKDVAKQAAWDVLESLRAQVAAS
ncbi:MAG: hypothetical protein QGG14_07700 [Planctomycetota bacterium]|jgi:hypothetical protein|nr:hypothetical protein [Planctomycetota bacterium]